MADGNVDLNFIAAQLGEVLGGQRQLREDNTGAAVILEMTTLQLIGLKHAVSELVSAVAAKRVHIDIINRDFFEEFTRADIGLIEAGIEDIRNALQAHEARLDAIGGRLADIQEHIGLRKAS